MVVLALDTATRQGSAALSIDGQCDTRVGDPSRTHGERLPGELIALLATHKLAPRDVDRYALVAGPGSFTGLRVGAASIQGLAFATGRLVTPIPTLDAMAEGWRTGTRHSALGTGDEPRNPALRLRSGRPEHRRGAEPRNLVVALDGQRGDLFFAAWRLPLDEPIELATRLIEPSVGTADDLVRVVHAAEWTPTLIVGIGLDRHADALRALNAPIEPLRVPLAEVAATIAARRPELGVSPHALRPMYIRRPDAVLARERAGL